MRFRLFADVTDGALNQGRMCSAAYSNEVKRLEKCALLMMRVLENRFSLRREAVNVTARCRLT